MGPAAAVLSEAPTGLGWKAMAWLLVPQEAMLRIVTHQTTGAEDEGPLVGVKTQGLQFFVLKWFSHTEPGVAWAMELVTTREEVGVEGMLVLGGTQGLRRQDPGHRPHRDGSIALSQVWR